MITSAQSNKTMTKSREINKNKLLSYYQLKNINRYSMRFKINEESVAEHSYFVSLFTSFICDELKLTSDQKLKCINHALFHDLGEIQSGDIVAPVKQASKELRDALLIVEFEFINKHLPQHFKDFCDISIPKDEEHELYAAIVSLADIVSVLQYAYLEVSMGNSTAKDIVGGATTRYNKCQEKIYNLTGQKITLFEEKGLYERI